MTWLFRLMTDFLNACGGLYTFMTTPQTFLGNVSPISLFGVGLFGFLVLCLSLRIIRG